MTARPYDAMLRASRAYGILKDDASSGLGHAYMLVSPDDDAVAELFTLTAETVFCESGNACGGCKECLKVIHGNHPDVIRANAERTRVKVQEIRDLLLTADIKSFTGRKLYFIERADLMAADAQNKLLKTLEEPPSETTFFLGAANPSGMLETVKSRCRAVFLDSFDYDEIFNALISAGVEKESAGAAAACSEGLLGKAFKIAESPSYAALYASAADLLGGLLKSADVLRFGAETVITDNLGEFLNVLALLLRDIIALKNGGEILSKHISGQIAALSDTISVRAAAEIILSINGTRKKLALNVNAQAALESLLFSILEVKYKWRKLSE